MSESVAQGQLKAFVDRILRMREEQRSVKDDIREIYAEAKGNGFDKTVLGKVVNYIEKRAAGAADLAESEALFDLYLTAYDGSAGTENANAHVHEATSNPAPTHVAAAPGSAESKAALSVTEASAMPVRIRRPRPGLVQQDRTADTKSMTGGSGSAEASGDEKRFGAVPLAPIPPETVVEQTPTASVPFPIPSPTVGAPPAPYRTPVQQAMDEALARQAEKSRKYVYSDPPHPDCLDPDQCGGFSNHGICERCKAVLRAREQGLTISDPAWGQA